MLTPGFCARVNDEARARAAQVSLQRNMVVIDQLAYDRYPSAANAVSLEQSKDRLRRAGAAQ
jgi:hypothetical protein